MLNETNDYHDIPFADPKIRTAYESALGRFILAFNEIDYFVGQLIAYELDDRGRADWSAPLNRYQFD